MFLAGIFGSGQPAQPIAPIVNQPAAAVVAQATPEQTEVYAEVQKKLLNPAPSSSAATVQYITQPTIERTVASAPDELTVDEKLAALRSELVARMNAWTPAINFSGPAAYTPVSGAAFAPSQRIDQLSGTSLSDITVNGVSGLTDADIPDTVTASNYLLLSGGSLASTTISNLNLTTALAITSGGTGGISTTTARSNLGLAYATSSTAYYSTYKIAAWGDSLTGGAGGQTTYLTYLSQDLGGRPVYQGGVGAETSTQIATRMLAAPTKNSWTTIIWAGANNATDPTTVESDIASMVSSLGGNTHYLILTIPNGSAAISGTTAYNDIIAINAWIASNYPNNYFDIRTYLIQHGLSDVGITPTGQDNTDIANDTVPTSLRIAKLLAILTP